MKTTKWLKKWCLKYRKIHYFWNIDIFYLLTWFFWFYLTVFRWSDYFIFYVFQVSTEHTWLSLSWEWFGTKIIAKRCHRRTPSDSARWQNFRAGNAMWRGNSFTLIGQQLSLSVCSTYSIYLRKPLTSTKGKEVPRVVSIRNVWEYSLVNTQ